MQPPSKGPVKAFHVTPLSVDLFTVLEPMYIRSWLLGSIMMGEVQSQPLPLMVLKVTPPSVERRKYPPCEDTNTILSSVKSIRQSSPSAPFTCVAVLMPVIWSVPLSCAAVLMPVI